MKRLRISQCMIVKNEEKNIRQALSWGKGILFEQIVVDTGSTDRTVEIAKEMGAKVYHFQWIDDFSAAKNFALDQAKGDWIAFLDADEYLTEEWAKKLPQLIQKVHQTHCIGIRSPLVDIDEHQNIMHVARQWRFFRWLPQLRYINAVHEALAFNGEGIPDAAMWDTGEEFPVYHTGYIQSVMDEKQKHERNIALLKKELEKRPQDYNIMGYLGDSYRCKGDAEEAEKWFRKSIEAMPEKTGYRDERSAMTYVYFLANLVEEGEKEESLEWYEKAKAYMPWVYDFDFIIAVLFYREKAWEKALVHLERALAVMQEYGDNAYGIFLQARIAEFWEYMAVCYYETGNLKACVERCVGLLKEDKQRVRALTILFQALKAEKPEAVLRFLGNIYTLEDAKDRILLIKGAVLANAAEFLEVFKQIGTPEEQEFIEKAIQKIRG